MFFNLILFFCIIQNASPIPYKHSSEIKLRNFKRHGGELLNYDKIDEKPSKRLFKEDSLDLSSESKRLFDWIKRMINKNGNKVTTPSYDEVLDERTRFRQIEKNLTETLTKLSRVLAQILNIVKYARYTHFDDIHKFLPTKLGSKQINRHDYRFRRNSNKGDIVLAKLNINNGQENNINNKGLNHLNDILPTKLSSANFNSHENKTKIVLNKSGNIVQKEIENKNLYITKTGITKYNVSMIKGQYNLNDIPRKLSDKDLSNQENNPTKTDIYNQNNQDLIEPLLNHPSDAVTTKVESETLINNQDSITKTNRTVYEPAKIQETRVKRDVTELKKSVTEKPETMKVEKAEGENKNVSTKIEVADATTDAEISKTGRRAISPKEVSNDEVKNHLFKYIDEAFSEIANKIDSLRQTKQMFSKDVSYQVGYIISNIDTLEVNMRNMKRDMDRNKYVWDDKKILNLYDTVKVSNQAVADLLEILKSYVEKSLN